MSRDTVGPSFHEAVRRTFSIGSSKGRQNGGAVHEETPLLAGANSHYTPTQHSATYDFFLNPRHTPGADSDKFYVKAPAHVWHITKATLLSSKFFVRPLIAFVQPLGWEDGHLPSC
jgi:Ca2+:H+ antiporter